MTDEVHSHTTEEQQVAVRVDCRPKYEDSKEKGRIRKLLSKLWNPIWMWIAKKSFQAFGYGEDWVDAKVRQESGKAEQIVAEAAESLSRSELNRQNARLVKHQADGQFLDNLEKFSNLSNREAQLIALANLFESNPEIAEQIEKVKSIEEKLRLTKGTEIRIAKVDDPEQDEEI